MRREDRREWSVPCTHQECSSDVRWVLRSCYRTYGNLGPLETYAKNVSYFHIVYKYLDYNLVQIGHIFIFSTSTQCNTKNFKEFTLVKRTSYV